MTRTVGVWLVVQVLLGTSQCRANTESHGSECQAVRLTGTHDPSLSGLFVEQLAVTSHDKPVYQHQDGRHTLCAVASSRWIVTLSSDCVKSGARIFVDDDAKYPHHVTATWKECVPEEGNPRCWGEAPSIRVTCEAHSGDLNPEKAFTSPHEKPKECQLIRFVNVTLDSNTIYRGVYRKIDVICNDKYVYHKPGVYVVYWAGQWRAYRHSDSCLNVSGDITVKPLIRRLPYINVNNKTWAEWDGSRYVKSHATMICEDWQNRADGDRLQIYVTEEPKPDNEVWILYVALAVGAVVTVIIIIAAIIAIKSRRKHSERNQHANNDVRSDVTIPAPVSFDNKHLSVNDSSQDPDEFLIVDNAIYATGQGQVT